MFGSRWYIVSLLAALSIFSYIDRLILTLMVDPIKADFGLTDTQMGLLIGPAFAFLFSLAGLPVAWIADRGNRKRCVVIGAAIWSIATILSGFATSFATLFVLRTALAIGEAVLVPVAFSVIGDLFQKHERSTPGAVFTACYGLGIVLAYAVGGVIINVGADLVALIGVPTFATWRIALVVVGVPTLLLTFVFLLTTTEPARSNAALTPGSDVSEKSERFGLFASRREMMRFFSALLIGNGLLCIPLQSTLAWYPTHLTRTQGVSASEAGYIFAAALLGNSILLLAGPIFAERTARTGRKDLLFFIPLLQMPLGLTLFVLSLLQTTLLAGAVFMALGYSLLASITGLQLVAVPLTAPPAYRGRMVALMGVVNSVIGIGVGPPLVGFMSDTVFVGPGSLGSALLVVLCTTIPLAWFFYVLSWKPYRAAVNRVAR